MLQLESPELRPNTGTKMQKKTKDTRVVLLQFPEPGKVENLPGGRACEAAFCARDAAEEALR